MNKTAWVIVVIVLVLIIGGAVYAYTMPRAASTSPSATTTGEMMNDHMATTSGAMMDDHTMATTSNTMMGASTTKSAMMH